MLDSLVLGSVVTAPPPDLRRTILTGSSYEWRDGVTSGNYDSDSMVKRKNEGEEIWVPW